MPEGFLLDRGLTNYWGYNSIGYFAPHQAYSAAASPGQVTEFKDMVKALHRTGIEVILDVVYNHTAEGNENGPTLSFRGLDNPAYYRLIEGEESRYYDTTGTANSVNAANPVTLRMIMDSLRYWVAEMHVDGFRFDLAATLGREEDGAFDRFSAFFQSVAQDPVLSRAKLIAEPWDVGQPDSYDLGRFPGRWREWNGRYRDSMRDFWRSEDVGVAEFATRFSGSSDLYGRARRRPTAWTGPTTPTKLPTAPPWLTTTSSSWSTRGGSRSPSPCPRLSQTRSGGRRSTASIRRSRLSRNNHAVLATG